MKSITKFGVWIDHSTAYILEFTSKPLEIKTIEIKETGKMTANQKNAFVMSYFSKK